MTTEIPRKDWKRFFDELSRFRTDWLATVEVERDDSVKQVLAEELPLVGLIAEDKEEAPDGVEIIVGSGSENHQTHNIPNPHKLFFIQENDNLNVELAITDRDNTTTLVHLSEPVPECVAYAECKSFQWI